MSTATATKPTEQQLQTLDITRIHLAPDNVRRDLGDLEELITSIKAVGILEPPIVAARPRAAMDTKTGPVTLHEADFVLVAGQRRLAAAKKAGLKEIQVVVRQFAGETELLEAQLIENLQRKDLDPMEEARAYQRLGKLGHSQAKLAERLGRSQSHVSKRLSLLELPEPAIAELHSGRITLQDAVELTRLAKYPDRIEKAIKEGRFYGGAKGAVDRQLQEVQVAERADATRARLQSEGAKLIKDVAHSFESPAGHTALGKGWNQLDIPVSEHKKLPCHRAAVLKDTGEAMYLCSDFKSHLKGKEGAKFKANLPQHKLSPGASATDKKLREKEKLEEEELKAARDARFKVIQAALKARVPKTAADHIILQLVRALDWDASDLAVELLGLVDSKKPHGFNEGQKRLAAYMAKGPDYRWRAALACALAIAEWSIDEGGGAERPILEAHFAYLKKLGHPTTPLEHKLIKQAR